MLYIFAAALADARAIGASARVDTVTVSVFKIPASFISLQIIGEDAACILLRSLEIFLFMINRVELICFFATVVMNVEAHTTWLMRRWRSVFQVTVLQVLLGDLA